MGWLCLKCTKIIFIFSTVWILIKKMYLYLTCKRLVLVLVYITSNLRSHIVRLACKNVTKFKTINFIGQHIVPKSYP